MDEDNSGSDEEDDADPTSSSSKKNKGRPKKRRASAPKASSKPQVRHSMDGSESLLGLSLLSPPFHLSPFAEESEHCLFSATQNISTGALRDRSAQDAAGSSLVTVCISPLTCQS